MHILKVPENIIRNIFDYLAVNEIYFQMRIVCRQLKIYSDGYLQIKGKFMLLEDNLVFPRGSKSAWMLYFIERKSKTSFVWIKSKPLIVGHTCNIKYSTEPSHDYALGLFGAVSNGKIIVGKGFKTRYFDNGSFQNIWALNIA